MCTHLCFGGEEQGNVNLGNKCEWFPNGCSEKASKRLGEEMRQRD